MGSIPQVQLPESPVSQYGNIMKLKAMMQGQQLQALQIKGEELQNEAKQHALNDQNAQTEAMKEWDGKDWNAYPGLIIKHGGSAQAVLQAKQGIIAYQGEVAKMNKAQLENEATRNNYFAQALDNVKQLPPDQQAAAFEGAKAQAVQDGHLDPQKAQSLQYQGPEQLAAMEKLFIGHSEAVKQQLEGQQTLEAAAKAQQAAVETQQKQKVLAGTNAQGMTAEQQATTEQGKRRLAIEGGRLAEEKRHNQATEGSLTNEALTMAAQQYATTGVMPAVGRTAGMRSQIMNEAARVYPKIDIASNAAAYKSNQAALTKLQTQADQVGAFENTAGKNLDVFLKTADKLSPVGAKFANWPIRQIKANMLGTADYAAFDAARTTALTEISKVLNSANATGVLSDSARHEVEGLIGENATLAGIKSAATILKTDMANRHQAYQEQIEDIKKRIGEGGEQSKPASGGTVKMQAPNGQTKDVPADQVDHYKSLGAKVVGQ